MVQVVSFKQALKLSAGDRRPKLLLGNGFSIACRPSIFRYPSLFQQANFKSLSAHARTAFAALGTTDFEVVMRALRSAAQLVSLYEKTNTNLAKRLRADADGLKEVLVSAIAESHPEYPSEIQDTAYARCRNFLANFETIYSLNYDLLLYWTIMHRKSDNGVPLPQIPSDDGFRTPDHGEQEYVTWDIENTVQQNVFYLHGSLHIFDAGDEIQKYTWIHTGVRLIEQIRQALQSDLYPLFVAEGDTSSKLQRIRHSDYLSRSYRSFSAINAPLFIHGHSLADNDAHILRLIRKGRVHKLFISLHSEPETTSNQQIIRTALSIQSSRRRSPLELYFYDADSAQVWN